MEALVKWVMRRRGAKYNVRIQAICMFISGLDIKEFNDLYGWNYFITRNIKKSLWCSLTGRSVVSIKNKSSSNVFRNFSEWRNSLSGDKKDAMASRIL